jgi:hypothetical protein
MQGRVYRPESAFRGRLHMVDPNQSLGEDVSWDMKHDEKRRLRQLKRNLKRAGNKRRRQHLKRELRERPEDAPYMEFDFGRDRSAGLNGLDRDATRRKPQNCDLK